MDAFLFFCPRSTGPSFRLRFARWGLAAWVGVVASISSGLVAADDSKGKPEIRVVEDEQGRAAGFEAVGLTSENLQKLARRDDAQESLGRILAVYVVDGPPDPERPPVAGSYSVENERLRFTPRFALRPGTTYRVVLKPGHADAGNAHDGDSNAPRPVTLELKLPAAPAGPRAGVTGIFPSADTLPENQLRFYIHFSAPMSRGEAYEHVRLLDSRGRAIALPFLELGEELWDAGARRFTLFIDPGRIKRGVKPREDAGPVLDAGHEYTLVVDRAWHDAAGRPLRAEFRKKFRAGPPVETAIDPAEWKIACPASESAAALRIRFPRPLDHALMQRTISVEGPQGETIAGKVTVSDQERSWEFVPEQAWKAGRHELVIDGALEDLAGNRVGEQFEVDRVGPIEKTVRAETFRVPFEIE